MGKLSLVGIGPGGPEEMTPRARRAIDNADLIVGYTTYIELLGDLAAGKDTFSTGMLGERERALRAIEEAEKARKVAVVSGGDPGIYGLAGLVLELLSEEQLQQLEVEVIPGITAACAAAALLGAPLMNDFAALSLSDSAAIATLRSLVWMVVCRSSSVKFRIEEP